MFWPIFFRNSPFQTKSDFDRIFLRNIYSTNFCQYLLTSFSKEGIFKKKSCCFLILGSKFSDPEFSPDEKSVWDHENQSWESNRGQQWLSRTSQIKNFQGFCWGQNFVLFTSQTWRDNSNIFRQVFFSHYVA